MITGFCILLSALGMGLALLTALRFQRIWLGSCLVAAAAAAAAAFAVLLGGTTWEWRGSMVLGGEVAHLRLDGISAIFVALLAVVGGGGALYSTEYWSERAHPRSTPSGRFWWAGMLASMGFVLLACNGLHFLLGWEAFAVCAYFLVALDRPRASARQAGWLYLAASHTATLSLFAFFGLLAARTGSWDLGQMNDRPELAPLFWLALFGFGIKAGVFPLHIWLPSAHASAPSHVSAMMSGVAIKMGIYGLVRFTGWLPTPPMGGWVVAALGVVSAVLGVVFALGQHDLKRLLAYHSVENIGIILIGVGFALVASEAGHATWGRLALAGGLLHVWNHGLFKSLLFLGAGSVLHATGTREMSRLGGLWRVMPWTTGLFALGAAAIAGLPPLNGFVSEWLVYVGLFEAVQAQRGAAVVAALSVVLLAVTGALALACFAKACAVVFLGAPRSEAARRAHECGPRMRGPMALLASACIAIGLWPAGAWLPMSAAVGAWHAAWDGLEMPASLVPLGWWHGALVVVAAAAGFLLLRRTVAAPARKAVTWDCGFAAPTTRMQYTAGSFAGIVTEWFDWILCPRRHRETDDQPFPRRMAFSLHTPETVLERVIEPIAAHVLRFAHWARGLQHGRVHAYLFYLLAGLGAIALLAWSGDHP